MSILIDAVYALFFWLGSVLFRTFQLTFNLWLWPIILENPSLRMRSTSKIESFPVLSVTNIVGSHVSSTRLKFSGIELVMIWQISPGDFLGSISRRTGMTTGSDEMPICSITTSIIYTTINDGNTINTLTFRRETLNSMARKSKDASIDKRLKWMCVVYWRTEREKARCLKNANLKSRDCRCLRKFLISNMFIL